MNISRLEQETIIIFNEEEKTATIDTCNKSLQNRLDGFIQKSSDINLVSEDEHGKGYIIPKKWIKVQMSRQLSGEERAKKALQAKRNFGK